MFNRVQIASTIVQSQLWPFFVFITYLNSV